MTLSQVIINVITHYKHLLAFFIAVYVQIIKDQKKRNELDFNFKTVHSKKKTEKK